MRVIHINTRDQDGGAARAAMRIHCGLRELGVESWFLARTSLSENPFLLTPRNPLQRVQDKVNTYLDVVFKKIAHMEAIGSWSFNTALFHVIPHFLREKEYDLVHLHWINEGFLGISSFSKMCRPIVWTLHDSWPFTGGCHIPYECGAYRTGCSHCPKIGQRTRIDWAHHIFMQKKKYYPQKMHIVCPSHWMAAAASSSALFSGQDIRVIPNGVDTSRYVPIDQALARKILHLQEETPIVLFGAMSAVSDRNKGFDYLCEALQQLKGMSGNMDIQLVVFGSQEPVNGPEFGFPTRYMGRLYDDISLCLLYSAADVMVVPSKAENFPNVVLEAMACGTPCVAFSVGGISEQIKHKETGFLAKPYDCAELAEGIAWILTKEKGEKRLSLAARESIETKFSLLRVAAMYRTLYEEILSGG